eukprot:403371411
MDYHQRCDWIGERIAEHMTNPNNDLQTKRHLMGIISEFPYAGMSISYLVDDPNISQLLLEKAVDQISIDDLEQLYIYEIDEIKELIVKLREKHVNPELLKKVFSTEGKQLRDKDDLKLKYFEFINYCIEGDINQVKYYIKSNDVFSVNYYYGLQKKTIRFAHKNEPPETKYFTPLIYCIFYDKPEILDYLISNDMINGFSALKEPPMTFQENEDEEQDELGVADDEWFQSCASEVFAIELLLSTKNLSLLSKILTRFQHQWHFTHFYSYKKTLRF